MIPITNKISIDFLNRGVMPRIDAVQGDANTREVEIALYNGGAEYTGLGALSGALAFKKPDGTSGLYDKLPDGSDAVNIDGHANTVEVTLAPQVLTCPGSVMAAVILNDADLNQIATFPFIIEVAPNPGAGKGISNDYYNYSTLADLNAAMGALEAKADGLMDDASIGTAAWSSVETVHRLCPEIGASGAAAVLENALEGYPVTVRGAAGAVCRTGRNLFDVPGLVAGKSLMEEYTATSADGTAVKIARTNATSTTPKAWIDLGPAAPFLGKTLCVSMNARASTDVAYYGASLSFFKRGQYKGSNPTLSPFYKSLETRELKITKVMPETAPEGFPNLLLMLYADNTQAVTTQQAGDYVEYSDIMVSLDGGAWEAPAVGVFESGSIPALAGTNCFYGAGEDLTVTGRADPKQLLDGLSARVAALEQAMVNS